MAKALAITTIHSDGSSAEQAFLTFYPTNPETGKPFTEEDGVWIKVRPISQRRYDDAERRHTHKAKDQFARRLIEEVDYRLLQDELLQFAIMDWAGMAARNAETGTWETLAFSEEVKTKLPAPLKTDLIQFAVGTQSVEVPAQSFRRTP